MKNPIITGITKGRGVTRLFRHSALISQHSTLNTHHSTLITLLLSLSLTTYAQGAKNLQMKVSTPTKEYVMKAEGTRLYFKDNSVQIKQSWGAEVTEISLTDLSAISFIRDLTAVKLTPSTPYETTSVYDLSGRLLYHGKDVPTLEPGIYLLVSHGKTKKIIIR